MEVSDLKKWLEVTSNIKLSFTPWFESGFRLKYLTLYEELGGNLAKGSIEFESMNTEEALKKLHRQFTGKITIEVEGSNVYEIDIFITNRMYSSDCLKLAFYCISDKKFFTELVNTEFPDITTAINALYPGKKDIRCETSIPDLVLRQNMETNKDFCTKLAYSFLKDTIFAFGWEGFLLKERIGIDSLGNQEPGRVMLGDAGISPMDLYTDKYNTLLFEKSENPWLNEDNTVDYSIKEAVNCKSWMLYDKYVTVGTEHSPLIENYLYNITQQNLDMFSKFRVESNSIPKYKLGDVLYYEKFLETPKIPHKTFLVKTNELIITNNPSYTTSNGSSLSWISTLVALDRFDNLLPVEEDYTKDIDQEGLIPENI